MEIAALVYCPSALMPSLILITTGAKTLTAGAMPTVSWIEIIVGTAGKVTLGDVVAVGGADSDGGLAVGEGVTVDRSHAMMTTSTRASGPILTE